MLVMAMFAVALAFAPAPLREPVSKSQARLPQFADETQVAIERAPISSPRPEEKPRGGFVICPIAGPCWLGGQPCRGATVSSCNP